MPPIARLLACFFVALSLACGEDRAGRDSVAEPPEVLFGSVKERDRSGKADGVDFQNLVAAQTDFSLRLFATLRAAKPDGNVAVGAYSVHHVLGMLYAGARGTTAEEMKRALGWQMPPERVHATMNALDLEILSRADDVTLTSANRIWAQKGMSLLPGYLDVLTRDYGAPLAVADFAADAEKARATINGWVGQATRGKIPQLFPMGTIHALTRLVLANAMYLDAPWKYRFDATATGKAAFKLLDGSQVQVDTMHYNEFLPSAWDSGWQAVELPYRGDELSMVIVVPSDLRAFEAQLSSDRLRDVFAKIKHGGIHLSLPKITFSFHASLVDALKMLGLPSMFGDADFSGMTGSRDLAVEHVEHEVFVEVDEEGTKAAAATGASLPASHGPTVRVDRPFLFIIRDRPTGAILFLGRVVDPRR